MGPPVLEPGTDGLGEAPDPEKDPQVTDLALQGAAQSGTRMQPGRHRTQGPMGTPPWGLGKRQMSESRGALHGAGCAEITGTSW